jgi:undecaprenyl-diphosphatase
MVELDRNIFLFINSHNSPFFDTVMWVISMKTAWIPLYLIMVYLLIRHYGKRVWITLLFVPLLIVITDQGASVIKDLTQRLRPCHEPSLAGLVHVVRGSCPGMYGFVSGHASNSFGLAAFTSILIRKKWYTWVIFICAILISYSRVYLGVHYPGDVLAGGLLGLIAGTGLALAALKTYQIRRHAHS